MYNLTHLLLGGNKLKDSLMSRLGNRTLESQVDYNTLTLSDNGIRSLPSGIFSNLHKLTVLHLNNNSLTDLAFLAGSLDRMIYLDISFNQLSDINDKAKHALDAIGHVIVNLQGNPLKCTCGQLATLNWFVRINVSFKGLPSLTCQSQNGSTVGLLTLLHEMQQVEIECWSIVIMISCIMTFLVLCFVLTIIALMYYKRWQIMYMYYSGKKHINPYGYEQLDQTYDAYLSYSDYCKDQS
ncbi:hypothetical protein FSP39_006511 [Pinctada imbricata]|uniref:Uncharacterized protein n=1 Tax=Pinctada imbricata TaxID=66713 RepID=A0AA88Y309_PINIB|nr:hypothetical protein FSP39_006511 [Pinctada imbricata]